MNIERVNSYDELSAKAKEYIIQELKQNKELLLCAATGATPTGTYRLLVSDLKKNPRLCDELRIIKLDEWGGIPMEQPGTCEWYIRENLLVPLQIPGSRYIGFQSNPENAEEECNSIEEKLRREGPIGLCILGLGMNGHLALNEPAEFLQADCHVSKLTSSSQNHPMASEMPVKPTFGLTLGMAGIFQSKKILILISGKQKRAIVKEFLSKKITPKLPATFLWLHPNVICLIEKDAIGDNSE